MKIFFVSMGCAKNTADSEHLIAQLEFCGHEISDVPENCEIGIINTCGFIQDSVKENIDAILDLEKLKSDGVIKKFIVAGCLVNRYENELKKEFPTADLFVRSEEWEKVIKFLNGDYNQNCKNTPTPINKNFWTRYLKISEGCDTLCSYCAIPLIRGRLRSVKLNTLIDEALMLCSAGAKEICLVGQDLTVYGKDFNDGTNLKTLIHELNRELPKDTWIRLLYLHPERVNEELIDFILEHEKVLHYLDIPIQHSEPEILAKMNRPTREGHMRKIFNYIREKDPLFCLRTTIMTGFPGETKENFNNLIDFISDVEFDRLGAFIFSPEEGTKAAEFENRIPERTAESRYITLMDIQAQISDERSGLFIDENLDVLIEDIDYESNEAWGRSFRDAPEVDGVVNISRVDTKKIKNGDVIKVKILDCEENDLFGDFVDVK
ncbi:MAG: 30S ribosomal protein S12 methylthiotransferase RimO [Synergistaceae bacterium]|nr:30S ribosomal protein S12 methylthiotransferase RimO [Synergistaceae bacterium]MBR0254256.1 30S ribosomal protein S12 methylthiotransferase RimO [Synergistaceae bacterium]